MEYSEQRIRIYDRDKQNNEAHAVLRLGENWLRTLDWQKEDTITCIVDRSEEKGKKQQPRLILQRTYRPPPKESKETKNDEPR